MKPSFLVLFAACCLFSPIKAQDWQAIGRQAEKQPGFSNQAVVTLLDSTSVNVSDNGSGTFFIKKVIKIQSSGGALKNRVLVYDYDPLTAFAQFKKIKVYQTDNTVRDIDPATSLDYPAPARAIYWGARQIMAEVGQLQPGDIVEYEIDKKGFTYALLASSSEEERFIPPMRGQFYDIVPFWVSEPTVRKVYRVSLPKEKDMQYQFYQGECTSSTRFDGKRKVYSFSKDNLLPFERESNMVDLFDVAPKLMMSSTPDWIQKSLWFHKVNEDYGSFAPTPEAQKKVDELIKGKKTEMEKIAVLTHWVADNMRYSGISMGKGEGYTLHNTKMNFTDRCGVCKDKAALLISMLRMAGFEAYPAMTMAGSRVESIPADHFNHSVTVVKLSNGTYIPLDPTWVPFLRELWSSAEQQQNYLPGVPEGSDLKITPVSAPENHYFKIHARTSIDEQGTLSGEFTVMAEGQSDGTIRRPFTTGVMADWDNALERELLKVSPQAKVVSVDYGKNPKDYAADPIRIKMKFVIPGYALTGENILTFKPLVFNNLYSQVQSYRWINTTPETKKYAFKDACSRYVELEETLTLPKGYKMVQQNREENKENKGVASFSGFVKQEKDQVKILQKLALYKRVYEAGDWTAFRDAVNAHKSFSETSYIFEK